MIYLICVTKIKHILIIQRFDLVKDTAEYSDNVDEYSELIS